MKSLLVKKTVVAIAAGAFFSIIGLSTPAQALLNTKPAYCVLNQLRATK